MTQDIYIRKQSRIGRAIEITYGLATILCLSAGLTGKVIGNSKLVDKVDEVLPFPLGMYAGITYGKSCYKKVSDP